jgi:hypothetical protein
MLVGGRRVLVQSGGFPSLSLHVIAIIEVYAACDCLAGFLKWSEPIAPQHVRNNNN